MELAKRLLTISLPISRNTSLKQIQYETGMVDHMIYGIRKINAARLDSFKKQKLAETRSLKRYNKALFQQDLQGIDWATHLTPLENEPSKIPAAVHDVFDSLLDMHAPLKLKKLRNQFKPWLTRSVRDLMPKGIK